MSEMPEFDLTLEFIQKLIKEYLKKNQTPKNASRSALNRKTKLKQWDIRVVPRYELKEPLE